MYFESQSIEEIILIKPEIFNDQRGHIYEIYQKNKYSHNGIDINIVQQNQSRSKKGVLRGLHYQIQNPQGKLVRVISGEIFDVAVDLRKSSPTFGKWVGLLLDSESKSILWIPPGFAHGFLALSDWAEIMYSTTDLYAPKFERTLIWNDPEIGIQWPLSKDLIPVLSPKDLLGKNLREAEVYE